MGKNLTKVKKACDKKHSQLYSTLAVLVVALGVFGMMAVLTLHASVTYSSAKQQAAVLASQQAAASVTPVAPPAPTVPVAPVLPPLDTAAFDAKVLALANGDTSGLWPVKTAYPLPGAILPFKRIVAYYGNFYSSSMGVLGEYPTDQMLSMLQGVVQKWQAADPTTPVVPAIHYIAVTAQGSPGFDGKYRARMPDDQIMKAIGLADQIHGIAFLDIQPGLSTVEVEVPLLEKYLEMAEVNLGIDPEFSMSTKGKKPGTVIGTIDASDINFVTAYLAQIVDQYHLPPKILVIHRFTEAMVTNYQNIITRPEVQIVMDMDGWGPQANKIKAYKDVIEDEPVQFTGFKLFYKNDVRNGSTMLTPAQILKLVPAPSYIQYQ